ncbi:tetratricopeptide repeat protein [Massilia sp. ST3]|uniref:tetratricopeptide repeat protein n=1 Tax=Massilia sp. ST3 TaxID=2824903 RepID=UPI001B8203A8|nr:tetratricopeptide repeat protein [Massilia sp. ST3]MBQ5947600.1 tetratricopeptide repeat protein [Massilia sp. ST3]
MSLINKMLQDLDARGGEPGAPGVAPGIKPVMAPERRLPWMRVAVIGGTVALLGAVGYAGYVGWRMKNTAVAVEVPVTEQMHAATQMTVTPLPGDRTRGEFGAAGAPAPPAKADPGPVREGPAKEEPATAKEEAAPAPKQPVARAEPAPQTAARPMPKPVPKPAPARDVAAQPVPASAAGRTETTAQRAENAYRRALANLEDGRVTEAIANLQASLRADPRHESARQTLVGLLIEAKRPEEAMRQLGAALALDARQPALAMLMARLQLERGDPAVGTLMRTLPYAAGNGDYHAFLAGVLQREERHREAAEHYQAALRTAPQNGVWWMGLGVSLQAEKRDAEAAGAFQRALATGTLSPELQAFVERKLKPLGR